MAEHFGWDDIKRDRAHDPAVRAGYDAAERRIQLGIQVRAMREAKGLSQHDLAKLLHTSRSTIAQLEAGACEPRIDTLDRVGRAFDAYLVVEHRALEGSSTV